MNKPKIQFLTPKWEEIKKIYQENTNGNDEYGLNFEIGGELDHKSYAFILLLGEITRKQGSNIILEDVEMDIWKQRIWAIVENSGLLAPIAWKMDREEEIDEEKELMEKQWYEDLKEWEIENEENAKTFVEKFEMTSSLNKEDDEEGYENEYEDEYEEEII